MERSQQLQTCQLNIILLMLIWGSCFNVQTVEAAFYPQTKRELKHIQLSIQYHELWYSYLWSVRIYNAQNGLSKTIMCSRERKKKRDELNLCCVNQGNSYCWQTGLSPPAFKVHVLAAHDCLKNTDKYTSSKEIKDKNNQKGWNCKPPELEDILLWRIPSCMENQMDVCNM